MSLTSRLAGILGSLARSPEARRVANQLARTAADRLQDRRTSHGGRGHDASDGGAAPRPRAEKSRGPHAEASAHPLQDRPSRPPLALSYAPIDDERADPGEVVWAWVAFEEDISRGKDRPVLVIGREDASVGGRDGHGGVLVALMLTSHDRGRGTHVDEHGNTWVDIGTGPWDAQGRPSEVRADRLLRIPIDAVRRQGARLDAARFAEVADATRRVHGWDR